MPLYPANPILILDDNAISLRLLAAAMRSHGINHLVECQDSRQAMHLLNQGPHDLVLLDLTMPEVSGEEILGLMGEQHPGLPVIVVTGVEDVETAVRCLKQGALDYMVKPVERNRLVSGVRRAIEIKELRDQTRALNQHLLSGRLQRPELFASVLTNSPAMLAIFQYLESIAASRFPVLVTGETGVGKELVVQAIHASSHLSGPLVSINVAGLDNAIFSDTLFGHVKGAFTGATERRQGLIEKATGGTLHLDEIGELSHESQVKLLRLLQEGEFLPLGADLIRMADVRVVASTNLDLAMLQKSGQFRKDLYYRLSVHHIHVPPLRERRDDIPLLLNHFIEQAARALGKAPPVLSEDTLMALIRYAYPGNVRELKTMVQDAVSRNQNGILTPNQFSGWTGQQPLAIPTATSQSMLTDDWLPNLPTQHLPTLEQATRQLMIATLERCHGNQSEAARILGISRQRLARTLTKIPSC